MTQIGRRVRAVVNPVSTSATGWWCHSGLRRALTGYGPTARQRRIARDEIRRHAGQARYPEHAEHAEHTGHSTHGEQMKRRAAAVDGLMRRD
jgi:hypothetical protein